jgi:hypothetical protein
MTGGEISFNASKTGAGVYVGRGTFTMSGNATISDNTSSSSGGGVIVAAAGSFDMSGNATISGNNAGGTGGGVLLVNTSSFTMYSGLIVNNTWGGLIYQGGGNFSVESNNGGSAIWPQGTKVYISPTNTARPDTPTYDGSTATNIGSTPNNLWAERLSMP